ncbi:MAG: N-acetylmuramic acid 6-phosphate etherase [Planctomycetes bacterium]|nr:N-acetylmuramic acid 6-phosphate etherase [Planctomycetota bacterium]
MTTPPTEAPHPGTTDLDLRDARAVVDAVQEADGQALEAVRKAAGAIAEAVNRVAATFRRGGRLIHVGAGTSGRLGALDAAECPPTFGVPPDRVVAVVAGGREALTRAAEGAEDRPEEGARAMDDLEVGPFDVVLGITASGTTPFVHGALRRAGERGAWRLALTSGLASTLAPLSDLVIALDTGPEVLAGSTRMKAGTATKMVLGALTTGAMVRSGRVYGNLMVDLVPSNAKLRRRALGILRRVVGCDEGRAATLLEEAGLEVKTACAMGRLGCGAPEARRRIEEAGGFLRRVIGEPDGGTGPWTA